MSTLHVHVEHWMRTNNMNIEHVEFSWRVASKVSLHCYLAAYYPNLFSLTLALPESRACVCASGTLDTPERRMLLNKCATRFAMDFIPRYLLIERITASNAGLREPNAFWQNDSHNINPYGKW